MHCCVYCSILRSNRPQDMNIYLKMGEDLGTTLLSSITTLELYSRQIKFPFSRTFVGLSNAWNNLTIFNQHYNLLLKSPILVIPAKDKLSEMYISFERLQWVYMVCLAFEPWAQKEWCRLRLESLNSKVLCWPLQIFLLRQRYFKGLLILNKSSAMLPN